MAISQYAGLLGDILAAWQADHRLGSTDGDLKYKRTYTDGKLWAPVTGYASQSYGSTQLEALDRQVLDGSDSSTEEPARGGDAGAVQARRCGHHDQSGRAEGRL